MRRADREIADPRAVYDIVADARVLHLGLTDGAYPYIVPMHYGFQYEDGAFTFYLHSANEGHKLDLIARSPRVCIELETGVEPISGGDVPCRYGARYRSFIGRGTASVVTDAAEKAKGLQLLMQRQTGRAFAFTAEMLETVTVIRVTVAEYSAKMRA